VNKTEPEILLDILKVLNRILFSLENMSRELRDLRSLIKSGQSASIQQMKTSLLKSKLRYQIYELCDGKHSVSEIAQSLDKPMSLISRYLKDMEKAGLIVSEQSKKERYYYKVV
jgi:DNA-binding transcriptional ArsR family regulator